MSILREEDLRNENTKNDGIKSVKELDESTRQIKEELRGIVGDIEFAIRILKSQNKGFEPINEYYKDGAKIALENGIELDIVSSYINFLRENKKDTEALEYAKKLEAKYTILDMNEPEKWASLYSTLSSLYSDKNFDLAKEYMLKAVKLEYLEIPQ